MLINIALFILSVFFTWWAITTTSKLTRVTFKSTAQGVLFNIITIVLVAIAVGLIVLTVIV